MKNIPIKLAVGVIIAGCAANALADDYYEFSTYAGAGSEYDVDSYGNTIYWASSNSVYSIDVSVADMSYKDESRYLADGVTANPNYQARVFTNPQTIILTGAGSNIGSTSEMYVTADTIYKTAYQSVLAFDKATGAYTSTVVTGGGIQGYGNRASLLAYDEDSGTWYAGNENRTVYSSTGGAWEYEFTWDNMAGGHGDGMEMVGGHMFVSDMTSNFIAQWDQASDGTWSETERFAYTEAGGSNKYVEGMGFGSLDHFWAGSGGYIYELGGGEIQDIIDDVEPISEPGSLLLLGAGLIGLGSLRRRKTR